MNQQSEIKQPESEGKSALVVVDMQEDFMPWGALPVPEGDRVIAVANAMLALPFDVKVATQDWHPADHGSFADQHPGRQPGEFVDLNGLRQILWPAHCVQETPGAEMVDGLEVTRIDRIFRKGEDPGIDSYSGFYDNGHRRATGMGDWLRGQGVTDLYVLGLALDYCVKFTSLDGRKLGFACTLIADGCRAVNVTAGDDARAVDAMRQAGVRVVDSRDVADLLKSR